MLIQPVKLLQAANTMPCISLVDFLKATCIMTMDDIAEKKNTNRVIETEEEIKVRQRETDRAHADSKKSFFLSSYLTSPLISVIIPTTVPFYFFCYRQTSCNTHACISYSIVSGLQSYNLPSVWFPTQSLD